MYGLDLPQAIDGYIRSYVCPTGGKTYGYISQGCRVFGMYDGYIHPFKDVLGGADG